MFIRWSSRMLESRTIFSMLATCMNALCKDSLHSLQYQHTCNYRVYTILYLMFGRETHIPADLMYGRAEPESLNYTEFAVKLRESLSKSYTCICKHVAGKQERQAETYKKKMHGKPHHAVRDPSLVAESISKWPEVAALPDKSATGIVLFKCFTRHGCCRVKISDQGREFVNQVHELMLVLLLCIIM